MSVKTIEQYYYQPGRRAREIRMEDILTSLLRLKDSDDKHMTIPYLAEIQVLYIAAENDTGV